MPCFWCTVNCKSADVNCIDCRQEASCCHTDPLMVTNEQSGPCDRNFCRLFIHRCSFQVGIERWQTCGNHRDMPLDAIQDHYVCSEHLAEKLQLEERYPSVVMSKCAAPECMTRCLPVSGENGFRYCKDHADNKHKMTQRPTSWAEPRLKVIKALRKAGLHGQPWNIDAALSVPSVGACYRTRSGAPVCCCTPTRNERNA